MFGQRERDRGAAAVEFALVLPILLVLVFGIIDFGRAYMAQISLTQAAREGARLSALGRPSGEVTSRVQDAAQPLTGVAVSPGGCPATPGLTDRTTVTATLQFQYLTPLPAFAGFGSGGTITLTGRGVMRCGG